VRHTGAVPRVVEGRFGCRNASDVACKGQYPPGTRLCRASTTGNTWVGGSRRVDGRGVGRLLLLVERSQQQRSPIAIGNVVARSIGVSLFASTSRGPRVGDAIIEPAGVPHPGALSRR
jgi:hypothetical protein